jgi:peptidyl-prolyl cis-trans isomerase C
MNRSSITVAAVAALALLAGMPAQAQDKAPPAPDKAPPAKAQPAAPAKAPAAAPATGKEIYPKAYFDFLLKERLAQGQPDTPELRNAIRDELNTRELLVREAKKKGLDKNADVKNQIDLASQTVLVRAYVTDWIKANPIPEAALRKEYDTIKAQMGDKEYKVRHILVEKEDEAKEIIAELQKGAKFEKLAERSKDPGSKEKGGDLDWNAPGNFVKPFSDAMVKLPKGKFTAQPVQTQFGWHVIKKEDERQMAFPELDQVKDRIKVALQAEKLQGIIKELREAAKIEMPAQ